jgi:hypothetical protein
MPDLPEIQIDEVIQPVASPIDKVLATKEVELTTAVEADLKDAPEVVFASYVDSANAIQAQFIGENNIPPDHEYWDIQAKIRLLRSMELVPSAPEPVEDKPTSHYASRIWKKLRQSTNG